MPDYQIFISRAAQKQLNSLPENEAEKLIITIKSLAKNPRPSGYIKLKGRDAYRIRKGNYRIIYEILDAILIVDIIAIGHRKSIYK
jgi:mRNA interferase RelE/StbE